MKIFLLGLPGSGKTTLGKELAEALELPVVDLDIEIEKEEKITISDIFQQKKEDYFRHVEAAQLKKWCTEKKDFVMATGGGAPVFFDNISVINNSGKSIFLDVPAREIAKRIMSSSLSERPLFAKTHPESLKDQIEFMRSQRISFYRQAHLTFTGSAIASGDILEKIRTENQS